MAEEAVEIEETEVETEAQTEVGTDTKEEPKAESKEAKSDKPEWLRDKFESPEQLAVAYQELQKRHYQRTDDLKKVVAGEMSEEVEKNLPEVPQDYKVSEDMLKELDAEIPEDDPMLNWWKERSYQLGLNEKQFNGFIQEYIEMQSQMGPDSQEEIKLLGEHGEKRVERVNNWFKAHMEKDNYGVLAQLPVTAPVIKALENVMELAGQPGVDVQKDGELKDTLTKDDLKNMMNDPRYYKQNDPVFRQKVKAGFDQLAKQGR